MPKSRFHRVTVPLEPFDSGLEYVNQPEKPELVVEWIRLDIKDPSLLAGVEINSKICSDMEASIYIGYRHNWVDVKRLHFKELAPNRYELDGLVNIEFENEGVAKNEEFQFKTIALFVGEVTS